MSYVDCNRLDSKGTGKYMIPCYDFPLPILAFSLSPKNSFTKTLLMYKKNPVDIFSHCKLIGAVMLALDRVLLLSLVHVLVSWVNGPLGLAYSSGYSYWLIPITTY